MRLSDRLLKRSGQLTYEPLVDGAVDASPDVRWRWLTEWVGPEIKGAHVIDVGCWTGGLLGWAVERGAASVTGVDLPGPWLEVARERVPAAEIISAPSLEKLPSKVGRKFDMLFFLETLEHLPRSNEANTLTALRAMLKTGGQLVISTPAAGVAAITDPAWLLTGHRHYRVGTLKHLLESSGFEPKESRWSGNMATALHTNAMYIDKHILRRPTRNSTQLSKSADTGLRPRRTLTTANVWLRATASGDIGPSGPKRVSQEQRWSDRTEGGYRGEQTSLQSDHLSSPGCQETISVPITWRRAVPGVMVKFRNWPAIVVRRIIVRTLGMNMDFGFHSRGACVLKHHIATIAGPVYWTCGRRMSTALVK